MNNIRAVIFDMDGVIIDSQDAHYKADLLALEYFGKKQDLSFVMKGAGTTTIERFTKWKEELEIKDNINFIVLKREKIVKELFINGNISPIMGVYELLTDIKNNNIKIALASSSSHELINTALDTINYKDFFDIIVSGQDMEKGKPAPDIFLEAAKLLNVETYECIVVEDSENGVKAGVLAGMKVLGYINPSSGLQDLSRSNKIIEDFRKCNFHNICNI